MSEELELTPVYFENDGPYQDAQSVEELERYVMGSTFPKTPAEWWARGEIESLRARIAELSEPKKDLEDKFHSWRVKSSKASIRIAELEAAIEPFRRVEAMLFRQMKAITSIYEYVPVEDLRDDWEFNFKMTGAEIKRIYAALKEEKK